MVGYATQVSWVLIAAFALSLLYELYRATAKAGTSKYDSMRIFLTQAVPSYAVGFALAVLMRTGWQWVAWTALALAVALVVISIFYHSPIMLPQRRPGPIDWLEDKVYTGLLFVAVASSPTTYSGRRWSPSGSCESNPGDSAATLGGRPVPVPFGAGRSKDGLFGRLRPGRLQAEYCHGRCQSDCDHQQRRLQRVPARRTQSLTH